MRRHNVSETILREAVRQLEQNGFVRTSADGKGAVIVASSPLAVAAQVLSTYLHLIDVKPSEILGFAAYYTPGMSVVASQRLQSAAVPALRDMAFDLATPKPWLGRVASMRGFFREIASITTNPLFLAVSEVLFEAMAPQMLHTDEANDGRGRHIDRAAELWRSVAEAMIAGDAGRIYTAFNWLDAATEYERLSAERRRLARAGAVHAVAPEILTMIDEPGHKRQLLAFQIAREILESGAEEGARVGQEGELLTRYGVSRREFREAARILELHQICRMRRGNAGGLIVGAASGDYAVQTAISCLFHAGVSSWHARELRRLIEPRIAEQVAKAHRATALDLRKILASAEANAKSLERFRTVLVSAGDNRLATLVSEVLARLDPPEGPAFLERQWKIAEALTDAVELGDGAVAARCMTEFLDAKHAA